MSIISDTWEILKGQDLDTPQSESKKSKTERKAQTTKEVSDSLVYAAGSDVNRDLVAALAGKKMSAELRKLLNALASAQDDKPSPDEYYLEYRFINKDTRVANTEAAKKMLAGGMTLDEMEGFNIVLAVVRKRKLDDAEIGEANGAEYDKVRKELKDKYYPG